MHLRSFIETNTWFYAVILDRQLLVEKSRSSVEDIAEHIKLLLSPMTLLGPVSFRQWHERDFHKGYLQTESILGIM